MRPRNSGLVAASIAPMLASPSQMASDSRPASTMVTTTSPRFTSSARKRAAHKVIDVCSWAQVADGPSTVRTNCRSRIRLRHPIDDGGQRFLRRQCHAYFQKARIIEIFPASSNVK